MILQWGNLRIPRKMPGLSCQQVYCIVEILRAGQLNAESTAPTLEPIALFEGLKTDTLRLG